MNIIDIIILCCLVPAIIRGVSKGFVNQAFSLLALIIGAWLSFKFSSAVGELLVSFFDLPAALLHVIAFALILLIVMLFVHLVGKVIEKILKVVMLGWLNKLFGAVFGLLKAVLIIGLLILLFNAINTNIPLVKEETINGSILYGPIKDIANIIFPYLKELIFKK